MNTYFAIGSVLALVMVVYVVCLTLYKVYRNGEETQRGWLPVLLLCALFTVLLWPVTLTLILFGNKDRT